jgi:hypothetical protein
MITSLEFDTALQLIVDYKLQLNKQLEASLAANYQKIDVSQEVTGKTFKALQSYYALYYDIKLQLEDLKVMDGDLLATIDYDKMLLMKGFGRASAFNFRKLMITHSVLDEKDL